VDSLSKQIRVYYPFLRKQGEQGEQGRQGENNPQIERGAIKADLVSALKRCVEIRNVSILLTYTASEQDARTTYNCFSVSALDTLLNFPEFL
jgi:hypothetical protein